MKFLTLAIACLFFSTSCISQADTVYKYFDKQDVVTSVKALSDYYSKSYNAKDGWHQEVFNTLSDFPFVHKIFFDTSAKIPVGKWYYYTEKGMKNQEIVYKDGKVESSSFLNENGKKEGEAVYDTAGNTISQKGWDENGKEIPGYIFEQEAEFPGGKKGWQQFLQRVLKSDVPAKKRAPEGRYSVIAAFIVDKEGKLSDITAQNDPGYGTKEEVIRVLNKSPLWIPAISNNKKVKYRARQQITFVVSKE